jgi:hypothetical protein
MKMAYSKHETINKTVNTLNGLQHQDFNWKQITNRYNNTCCVCNRKILSGETILWNKEHSLVMHLPETCEFLGTRKKMPKRKKIQDNGQFPVEVTYVK